MLRSTLNPEEQGATVGKRLLYRTGSNRYRLLCAICGDLYYVDESAFRRTSLAVLEGIDNPFFCQDCEERSDVWPFAE